MKKTDIKGIDLRGFSVIVFALFILFTGVFAVPQQTEAATKKITLNAGKASIYAGETYQVSVKKVTGLKSKAVTYKSSKKSVATVSGKGLVTAKKAGTVTITVASKANSKVRATVKLTVKAKPKKTTITLTKKSAALKVGGTATIKVKSVKGISSKSVTFKSSDKSIATVSKKGLVKAKKTGTATITVTSAVNKKAKTTFKVTVKKSDIPVTSIETASSLTLEVSSGLKIATTVAPVNATNKKLTFKSSNTSVVRLLDNEGTIFGVSPGTATITISSADGGATKKVKVTVKRKIVQVERIDLTNVNAGKEGAYYYANHLGVGKTYKITADVFPANATDKSLYWTSSDPTVATVSKDGTVTGISKGECYIQAHSCSGPAESKIVKFTIDLNMTLEESYQYLREHPEVQELELYLTVDEFRVFYASLKAYGIQFGDPKWYSTADDYLNKYGYFSYVPVWGSYEEYNGRMLWDWYDTYSIDRERYGCGYVNIWDLNEKIY